MTHCSYRKTGEERFELRNGYELQLVPAFDRIDERQWRAAVHEANFFLQPEYLRALEKTAPSNLRFHYALVSRQGRPLLASVFQVIHIGSDMLAEILAPLAASRKYVGFLAGWREWMKKGSDNPGMRVLISGNNFVSGEYGMCCATGLPHQDAFDVLADVVRVILKYDRAEGLISTVLVKDFYRDNAQHARRLRRSRYHEFLVEPEMIVDIDPAWGSFSGYQDAMSKKYRNRLKSTLKKSAPLQVTELDAAAIQKHSRRMMELYLAVHEKASFRLSALTPEYFAEMKAVFGSRFRFVAYFHEAEMAGFRTAFLTGADIEAHFIGIDYTKNADFGLYQQMLYDYVRDGIEAGAGRVFLGRTASEIKSTVGARAHDLTCFIRHRNTFSNHVIGHFLDYLRPSDWVPRNPFKEIALEM